MEFDLSPVFRLIGWFVGAMIIAGGLSAFVAIRFGGHDRKKRKHLFQLTALAVFMIFGFFVLPAVFQPGV